MQPSVLLSIPIFQQDRDAETLDRLGVTAVDLTLLMTWLSCQALRQQGPDSPNPPTVRASHRDIQTHLNVSTASLRTTIHALESLGHITHTPRLNAPSVFTLLWPLHPEPTPTTAPPDPAPPLTDAVATLIERERHARINDMAGLRRALRRTLEALEGATREQASLRKHVRQLNAAPPSPPSAQPSPVKASQPYVATPTPTRPPAQALITLFEHLVPPSQGVHLDTLRNAALRQLGLSRRVFEDALGTLLDAGTLEVHGRTSGRRYYRAGTFTMPAPPSPPTQHTHVRFSNREQTVLEDLRELMTAEGVRPAALIARLRKRDGLSESAARQLLQSMVTRGKIRARGRTKGRRYVLPT